MHPVEEIRGEKSWDLKDKKIVLGITGSVAAIESFHLCRELIRHGANVVPFMSEESTKIIHPDAIEFASGKKPIMELGGQVEHVKICKNEADLILIAPCTANTISKIALGIADNALTSCIIAAEDTGIPILIAPAMHLSMYKNIKEQIETLKARGFIIIDPEIKGKSARLASVEKIVGYVKRALSKKDLYGKKILIIGGASVEYIDNIRFISNRSSGKMAISLAIDAFERGAEVELWHGLTNEKIPDFIPSKKFESARDLLEMVEETKKFDFIIVCAALANYVPERYTGKLSSDKEEMNLRLKKIPYFVEKLRKLNPHSSVVAFKAEEGKENIEGKARELLDKFNLDMVVANTLEAFGADECEIWIVDRRGTEHLKGNKKILANSILTRLKHR